MRVIGHRGAAAVAPENTIPSFVAAIAAGADAVEFDARLTADGIVVLMHDDDVSRTTDGAGLVSELTFEKVRALDAAARFASWNEPVLVPTLQETLEAIAGRVGMCVELKGAMTREGYRPSALVADAVAESLSNVPGVVVSSFDHGGVERARRMIPGIMTGVTSFAFGGPHDALEAAVRGGHEECHVPHRAIDEAFVRRAHEAGRRVLGWTVNDPERVRELARFGVDGIFTDDPAAAREALTGSS